MPKPTSKRTMERIRASLVARNMPAARCDAILETLQAVITHLPAEAGGGKGCWLEPKQWCDHVTDETLDAAYHAAYGPHPHGDRRDMLRLGLVALLGKRAEARLLWPCFWGRGYKKKVMVTDTTTTPANTTTKAKRRWTPRPTATAEEEDAPPPPPTRHCQWVHAMRRMPTAIGTGTGWHWGPPTHPVLDSDEIDLWTVYKHVLVTVQITTDPVGPAWDGRWPLRHGALRAVYLRINPGAYWKHHKCIDPPLRHRLLVAECKLWSILNRIDRRVYDPTNPIEVRHMFYDDPSLDAEEEAEGHTLDEGDDVIVYVPPPVLSVV